MRSFKFKTTWISLITFFFAYCFYLPSPAEAGDTLIGIKTKGELDCGISDGVPGFSIKSPDGQWTGMDVDFCRALAAAVLGNAEKINFVPLHTSQRFPALKDGEIDVLARNTTWTLEREATLQVVFTGILYYGGQGFLVPAKNKVKELSDLQGETICVVKGTTHQMNLEEYFRGQKWS